MKRKNTIIVFLFFQLLFLIGAAQNNDLKFNLVEGPNGKPLGKINAITQDPAWIHVVRRAERKLPLPL